MTGISVSRRDLESLLTAIYALDLDERAHVRALRDVWARPSLGGELAIAFSRKACPRNVAVMEHFEAGDPEILRITSQLDGAMSRQMNLGLLRGKPRFGLVTNEYGRSRAMRVSRQSGFFDFLGVVGPTNTGFLLTMGAPTRVALDAEVTCSPVFNGLAHHMAGAWRLRKRLAATDCFEENAEAIFHPDGRVSDALGNARQKTTRERLRALVLSREQALRASDGKLWPAVLDGRYTIIDRFERSGARYVIAYRNSRTMIPLVKLTPLERAVAEGTAVGTMAKVLALELGLSRPRISNILRAALRKLGLANALELTLLASSSAFVTLDDELLGPKIVGAFALKGSTADGLLGLTPAERAIAADILRGLSNREIGAHRNRSERTIANQVASILDRMRVSTRRALVAKLTKR